MPCPQCPTPAFRDTQGGDSVSGSSCNIHPLPAPSTSNYRECTFICMTGHMTRARWCVCRCTCLWTPVPVACALVHATAVCRRGGYACACVCMCAFVSSVCALQGGEQMADPQSRISCPSCAESRPPGALRSPGLLGDQLISPLPPLSLHLLHAKQGPPPPQGPCGEEGEMKSV